MVYPLPNAKDHTCDDRRRRQYGDSLDLSLFIDAGTKDWNASSPLFGDYRYLPPRRKQELGGDIAVSVCPAWTRLRSGRGMSNRIARVSA